MHDIEEIDHITLCGMDIQISPLNATEVVPILADVFNRMFYYDKKGLSYDKWLTIPHRKMQVIYKYREQKWGVPAGALWEIWKYGRSPAIRTCVSCKGRACYMYFAAGLSCGGLWYACRDCGTIQYSQIGGIVRAKHIYEHISGRNHPYCLRGIGGGVSSSGKALMKALGLGDRDSPWENLKWNNEKQCHEHY